jgi:Ca-activated chloride channel family protein
MKPVQFLPAHLILVLVAFATLGFADDTGPTQGAICYTDPDSGEELELPLQHTEVEIQVSGTVAEVTVTQTFSNPLQSRLEAVYVFPLPDRAAVDDMSIRIGQRLVRGEIHRRQEARRIYEQARAAGHLTGLLDQERPNIFTQSIANIVPGETIEVVIHYVEDLHYDHGTWRLVFPMVVGPRYIPGNPTGANGRGWSPDTDQVPDASRITPPVLEPGERSGHDIAVTVDLEPGFPISELASSSHSIRMRRRGRSRATVTLARLDTIPNKDLVLTWRTAGDAVESALVAHKTGELGYLTLILQPPRQPAPDQVVPRELVFVVDTSGSMSGEPIAACKQLIRKALQRMRKDDTFRLIRFSGNSDQLHPDALPATRSNVESALAYLDGMRGGGGTEMLAGVRAALQAPKDPYRLRMVLFLTDGYVGNEAAIIAKVGEALGDARVFSLGIGSSVNRYLLDRMAEVGCGVAEYLRPGESSDQLIERFYRRITDPVFTQLELDWGGLEVSDVEPARLPDLFAAQPLLIHARYRNGGRGEVTLKGWAGTERLELSKRIRLPDREEDNAAQAKLWARSRIARLELDKLRSQDAARLTEEVTQLALAHRLMTAYTSFVAVDRTEVRRDGELVTIDQPVPMPEVVSYEGVFGDSAQAGKTQSTRQIRSKRMLRRVPIPDPTPDEPEPLVMDLDVGYEANFVMAVPDAPPPPQPEGPIRYSVGGDLSAPQLAQSAPPSYPEAARRARIEGAVVTELDIDKAGAVTDVKVLRGLPLGLTEKAVEAVRQWRFQPATLNGRPVATTLVQTVHFKLDSGAEDQPVHTASHQPVEPSAEPASPEPTPPPASPTAVDVTTIASSSQGPTETPVETPPVSRPSAQPPAAEGISTSIFILMAGSAAILVAAGILLVRRKD